MVESGAPFGAYVHIPFCSSRCDYCAFATWTDRHHLIDDYLSAVAAEIDRAVDAGMPEATSIFVGGGTPSLVPAEGLVAVLDHIPRTDDVEVTVEANPDATDLQMMPAMGHLPMMEAPEATAERLLAFHARHFGD